MKLFVCLLALGFIFFSPVHAQGSKSSLKARSAASAEIEDIKDF